MRIGASFRRFSSSCPRLTELPNRSLREPFDRTGRPLKFRVGRLSIINVLYFNKSLGAEWLIGLFDQNGLRRKLRQLDGYAA